MPPLTLTPREAEVYTLIRKGMSYAEIGERLSISYNTVASVAARLRLKFGVTSRAQMQALRRPEEVKP